MKKIQLIILGTVLKSLIFISCYGQIQFKEYLYSPSYNYGIMPDKKYIYQHLINDFVKSFHFDIGLQTNGKKYWHHYYSYPETGLTFIYYNLANKEQLGFITGCIPYITIKPNKNIRFYPSLKLGIGLVYCNKPFNRFDNYHNILISSNLNAALNSDIDINYKLNDKLALKLGLSLIHFSNGNTKVPNKGVNIVSSKMGLKYGLLEKSKIEPLDEHSNKKYQTSISSAISFTNILKDVNKGFNYFDIMFERTRQINPIYALGLGLDISFNNADTTNIFELEQKHIPTQNKSLGIKICNSFKFSRLDVNFHLGMHLFDSYLVYDWIIIRYEIIEHIKVNMSYKSFLVKGDHLGWGITYSF